MQKVDARGKSCPLPIVLLAKAVRGSDVGDQVEIVADDRAFPDDVRAWCNKTGNELLGVAQNGHGHFEAKVVRLR